MVSSANTLLWKYTQNTSKKFLQEAYAFTNTDGFPFNVTIVNSKKTTSSSSSFLNFKRNNNRQALYIDLSPSIFISYFDKRPSPPDKNIYYEYKNYECKNVRNMTSPFVCLNDWLMLEYEC